MANVLVRTAAPPQALLAAIRKEWESTAPDVPLSAMKTGDELRAAAVAPQRLSAVLLGAFGLVAILLAGVGLYSVMAFSVVQRSREIGIRIAIGGRPSDVLRDVMRSALAMTAVGVVLGFAGCLASMRLVASQVRDVSPYDGLTFASVAGLMILVSAAAALVPALRASGVDPAEALRGE